LRIIFRFGGLTWVASSVGLRSGLPAARCGSSSRILFPGLKPRASTGKSLERRLRRRLFPPTLASRTWGTQHLFLFPELQSFNFWLRTFGWTVRQVNICDLPPFRIQRERMVRPAFAFRLIGNVPCFAQDDIGNARYGWPRKYKRSGFC
jgi:hypothetical protein